ncbi:MAG: glycoside hydrolase [Candidatus Hydrogenedentes bacterium]|nr:glycoside hydrolase [Candidatus Hydrogenedentota bacterium]
MERRTFIAGIGGGALSALLAESALAAPGLSESKTNVLSPFAERTVQRSSIRITLGETRIVMRGPMFPTMARLGGDTVVLHAQAVEEGGPLAAVRSEDLGATWRGVRVDIAGMALNTFRLANGRCVSIHYETQAIDGKPGWRSTKRWESTDNWSTVRGPLEDGRLFLPADRFKPDRPKWFHGNTVQLPNGDLVAAMQDFRTPSEFSTFVALSKDEGVNWEYLSDVGSLDTIDDPEGRTKTGWTLWGPCEPNLVHLGDGRMVCVMRLVNDDSSPLMGKPSETYRDLNYAVPGTGIYPGNVLSADAYYEPGPPSAPLVISYSQDFARTWTRPKPMRQARGCFPRMALSDGVLALTYGGLAYPRWGNCVVFSTDGGETWTDEINFAPNMTTGYTDVLAIGSRKFLCVFDCTPPQPWTNHAAHWVGALDVTVA